ncbi:hypothetical protein CM54_12400 [Staphylococcus sp. TE8]|uniref:PH domain-containing protein n=2 Tax=Staphylococcus TaxID=1279 RepID=UPI0004A13799|nr:PH domain-containing protein [Staphylococcus sp. TE8]AID68645.1 YbdT-like protein [Staphylococcus sp. TE8]KDE94334.1 hypothetical protein CM54_12400 [Staphylococcus sp. TE8]
MENLHFIRIHVIWIFTEFFKIVRNSIALYFFLLYLFNKWISLNNMIIYIVVLFVFVYSMITSLLYWKNFKIYPLKNKIEIHKGSYFKKITYLNYDNVTGVNEKRNILEKILKLNSVIIKVNSIDQDESIIIPSISFKDTAKIKKSLKINEKKSKYKKENVYFETNVSDIMKNSLSSFNIILFMLFLYSLYSTISDYLDVDWIVLYTKKIIFYNNISMVISLIVLVLLSYVYTATKSLLKYSNFKLLNYDKYLITDYGVTLKKNISIEKNSISAIMIKSSLLQNLLNFEEVKVISMNPENEKKDKEIILPIIKKETSKKHLEKILNYNIKFLPFYKNETKIILLKLIRKTIVLLLFLSIDYFINNLYLSILIYMLCIYILLKQVISVFLTTYSFSNNFIVIKKQDFNRDILIIPTEKIEEIIIKQSFFQRAFNVGSIVIVNKAVPPSKFKILDININQLINFKNQLIKH